MSGRSSAIKLALALGAVAFLAWGRLPTTEGYSSSGELLLHRLPAFGADFVSYRMPLSQALAAFVEFHSSWGSFWSVLLHGSSFLLLLLIVRSLAAPDGRLDAVAFLLAAASAVATRNLLSPDLYQTPFLAVLALLLVLRARRPSLELTVLAACVLGAALLFRSSLSLFPAMLAVWALLDPADPKTARRDAAILFTVPYLFVLPWAWMNWTLLRKFAPFELGQTDCAMITGGLGLVETVEGDCGRWLVPEGTVQKAGGALLWSLKEGLSHPARMFAAFGGRIAATLAWSPLLATAAILAAAEGRRDKAVRALAIVAAAFCATHWLVPLEARYFYPLRPVLLALVASAAARMLALAAPRELPLRASRAAAGLLIACGAFAWILAGRYAAAARAFASTPRAELVERAAAANPDDAFLLHARGLERLGRGRRVEALADLEAAAALKPRASFVRDRAWARFLDGRDADLLALSPAAYGQLDDAGHNITLHLMKAFAHARARRSAEAEAALDKSAAEENRRYMLRGGQDEPDAYRVLTTLRVPTESFDFALAAPVPAAERRAMLERLTRRHPAYAAGWVLLARAALAANARPDAARALARAGEAAKSSADWAAIAGLRQELGDRVGTRAALAKAREAGRGDACAAATWLAAARVELAGGGAQDAAATLEIARDCSPSARELAELGGLWADAGDAAKAKAALDDFERAGGGDARAWITAARAREAAGDAAASRRALTKALDANPGPRDKLELAGLLRASGERDAARRALDAARGMLVEPGDLALAAHHYAALGANDRARELAEEIEHGSRGEPDALLLAAGALAAAGETARAKKSLEAAFQAEPRPDARRRRAALLWQHLGEPARAAAILRPLAAETNLAADHKDLGIAEYLAGDQAAALASLRRAVSLDASELAAPLTLATILERRGRRADAAETLEKALASSSGRGDLHLRRLIMVKLKELRGSSR